MTKIFWLLLLAFVSHLWRGYVLTVLWGWHIAPRYDVGELSIQVAMCATITYVMFSASYKDDDVKYTIERLLKVSAFALVLPAMTLLLGYLVRYI